MLSHASDITATVGWSLDQSSKAIATYCGCSYLQDCSYACDSSQKHRFGLSGDNILFCIHLDGGKLG